MQKLRIEFEDSDKFSLNKIWGGVHWTRRKALADNWHYWTEKALEDNPIKPIKGKSILAFVFQFRKNMLDSSNCAPMAKAIEDSLDREGIIETDTNKNIEAVIYASRNASVEDRKRMEYNYVDVYIFSEDEFTKFIKNQLELG